MKEIIFFIMKKLQVLITVFLFLLPTIAFAKLHSLQQLSDMVVGPAKMTELQIDGGISNKSKKTVNNNKDIVNAILDVAEKNNIDILYCGYDTNMSNFSESKTTKYKKTIFMTFNNKGALKLRTGRVLQKDDDAERFLSSANTDDSNQVGVLNWMSLGDVAEIRPWRAFENTNFWLHSIIILTTNNKKTIDIVDNVISDFKDIYGLSFVKSFSENKNLYDTSIYTEEHRRLAHDTIAIISCLYILVLVHSVFLRYKDFGVMKLCGFSNYKIVINLLSSLIKTILISLIGVFVVFFSYLIFKNENALFEFFKVWTVKMLPIILLLILINLLSMILIVNLKISVALKNKKPVEFLQHFNYIFKIIFASVFISYITSTTLQMNLFISSINNFKMWQEKAKNLVEPFGALFGDNEDGSWFAKSTMLAMKKLYDKLDNEGKTIYADFGNYSDNQDEKSSVESNVEFAKLHGKQETSYMACKSVTVNNNYLKNNPIYDIDNKRVDIKESGKDEVNLLVLWNLKKYEQEIIKEYGIDYTTKKQKKVNITYIKSNQKYFTYDLHVAQNKNNTLTNIPVVVVCNQENLDLDYYCCYGLNFIKVKNISNAYNELLPYLKETGLDNMYYSTRPITWQINHQIYSTEQSLLFTLFKLFFVIISLILLIISSSINYIEKHKVKNIVCKIFGTPFLKRYRSFYYVIILIWLLSYVILYERFHLILTTKIVGLSCLFDLIISTVFLKLYENKKISSVLKGE